MSKQRRQLSRGRGFTLIELLVVISIIALLISILLPALRQARTTAQTMKCLSNQRQVAVALFTYADSYDERFPELHISYESDTYETGSPKSWYIRLGLAGIIPQGSQRVQPDPSQNPLLCPSDVNIYSPAGETFPYHRLFGSSGTTNFGNYGSYGLTYLAAGSTAGNPAFQTRPSTNLPSQYKQRPNGPRVSEFRFASRMIIGGEPRAHREIEIEIPNTHPPLNHNGANERNDRAWEWERHTNGVIPIDTNPSTSSGIANAFYGDGHARTISHNGVDMVGIKEVPNNHAAILNACNMFVY